MGATGRDDDDDDGGDDDDDDGGDDDDDDDDDDYQRLSVIVLTASVDLFLTAYLFLTIAGPRWQLRSSTVLDFGIVHSKNFIALFILCISKASLFIDSTDEVDDGGPYDFIDLFCSDVRRIWCRSSATIRIPTCCRLLWACRRQASCFCWVFEIVFYLQDLYLAFHTRDVH